jgi:tetratricopeptide (TPR) repeat protein
MCFRGLTTSLAKLYNPIMSLKAFAYTISAILLMTVRAGAQDDKTPLFLNNRPLEDPSVIDITEIDRQYAKAAVQEYEKGLDEARKGDRAAAIARLEAAIRIEPAFFNAHNSLAILFHRMKLYPEAEKAYREAQKLNPRSVAPWINLGSVHIEQVLTRPGDATVSRTLLNEALKSLAEATRLQPSSAIAAYLTGVVYYMTHFFEEAEMHFRKALEFSEGRLIPSRLALADIYIRLQEWDNVVKELDAYLAAAPLAADRFAVRARRDEAAGKLEVATQ